jgi:hypothetical protein
MSAVGELSNDRGPLDPPTPPALDLVTDQEVVAQLDPRTQALLNAMMISERAPVTTATANDADCQLNRARPR